MPYIWVGLLGSEHAAPKHHSNIQIRPIFEYARQVSTNLTDKDHAPQ
jgi:hypothetical protein